MEMEFGVSAIPDPGGVTSRTFRMTLQNFQRFSSKGRCLGDWKEIKAYSYNIALLFFKDLVM